MIALLIYSKVKPSIAIPIGMLLDLTIAYMIANSIRG